VTGDPGEARANTPTEVFVSYAHEDRVFALKLAAALEVYGIRCWVGERHIGAATQWLEAIGKALRRCDWFIVVLTPEAVASNWVKHEVSYALSKVRYNDRLIPILKKTCEPEDLVFILDSLQRVDFRKSFAKGMSDLLKIWGIGFQR
jgi:hypothetical protein